MSAIRVVQRPAMASDDATMEAIAQLAAAALTTVPVGVNYEAGQCVEHAISSPRCVAAYNCQIAMDEPFVTGHAAPDEVRAKGRAETSLGVTDGSLRQELTPAFEAAAKAAKAAKARLVVQVARGRSAQPFWTEVVRPVLEAVGVDVASDVALITGYRTSRSCKRGFCLRRACLADSHGPRAQLPNAAYPGIP